MKAAHQHYMELALAQARKAQTINEVPVGALLINTQGDVISCGYNETITRCDPSAHAEMLVLRRAAQHIQNYRLLATTLYVTVEPCVMCMGAMIHARVTQVVFGAPDPKWGAAGSLYDFSADNRFNHRIEVIAGICKEDCQALMRNFFRNKR
jgi:tRNA(adenine34) deaminase